MARAGVTVGGFFAGSRAVGTRVEIEGNPVHLGFWEGRGGVPIEKIHAIINRHAKKAMEDSVDFAEKEYKRISPRRTGALHRSLVSGVSRVGDRYVGFLTSTSPVAGWLEKGTGIYGPRHRRIKPLTGKYMKFPDTRSGGFTLAGQVRAGRRGKNARFTYAKEIEGIRPRHYFERVELLARPYTIEKNKLAARAAAAELRAIS